MRERTKIRDVLRQVLKEQSVNTFSGRVAEIKVPEELPAALMELREDNVEVNSRDYLERVAEFSVELIIFPMEDPETEIEQFSEDITRAIRKSDALSKCTMEVKLEGEKFAIEGHGENVVAACEQTYAIRYRSYLKEPETLSVPSRVLVNGGRLS